MATYPTSGTTPWNTPLRTYIDNNGPTVYADPSGGDDLTALQAAVNAFGANGGVLLLRAGTYLLSNTLTIPNKVTVRGQGRSATTLKAGGSFPASTTLVKLGPASLVFATRLEDLTVDTNNVTGSQGVWGQLCQEMCGLSRVVVQNFKDNGIKFDTTANWMVEDCEIYPSTTGANHGIHANGAVGSSLVLRCTVGVNGLLTQGILAQNGTLAVIGLHVENCTDGILFDNEDGFAMNVTGPTVTANVTNLVRMASNSRYVTVSNITKFSATNTFKDDFFVLTNTDTYVQHAVLGDQYVARLHHYGDTVGFYGKAPVARGAALTAATAAAPAGGTGTAAGGWDTAAHRDTAITAINNLQTRVADLEARLNTSAGLGLISG